MSADTIFALSSARGRAAIAVIRMSGPQAGAALQALTGPLPEPRRAGLRVIRDPVDGAKLDQGVALWFPAPRSVTGEDVAELHVHGGPAVIAAVIGALAVLPGLRAAEAGEFTRRAFDRGRLDLTEVEGLADLLAAETEAQRRQALGQYEGRLSALYEAWRGQLLRAMARVEAAIDFVEEDLPSDLLGSVGADMTALTAEIARHLDDGGRGERLRDGVTVVVLGAPNSGKSSLVNALARRDVAIVSHEPGTTRDLLEVHLDLDGYPAAVVDTAGLREAVGLVEAEGIRRARARAAVADLKLVLSDASCWPAVDAEAVDALDDRSIPVFSKADRLEGGHPLRQGVPIMRGHPAMLVSVTTGEGLPALVEALARRVAALVGSGESAVITRARHRSQLRNCVAHLTAFVRGLDAQGLELSAEELRGAGRALGRLTGRIGVEELLGGIFAEFCIGK